MFRWLALKFLPRESQIALGIQVGEESLSEATNVMEEATKATEAAEATKAAEVLEAQPKLFEAKIATNRSLTATFDNQSDAPACDSCGSMMVRNAACYKCLNCGATSGCS
jgi:ribonucleoside-diphosphate reductase alpha chain